MRILGLDTATWRASVGALQNGDRVVERSTLTRGNHAAALLPLIEETLAAAGWRMGDLDALAVSGGPGSFSGLRVGLSTAKGIAYALDIPLVAVPTLEGLARTLTGHVGTVCPLLDARKGELYAAAFAATREGWTRLVADCLLTEDTLEQTLPFPCTILGDAVTTYGERLCARFGDRVTLQPFDTFGPRGDVIARLGWERFQAGERSDASALEPFYIRPSDAEVKTT